jgi:hypothetical protein
MTTPTKRPPHKADTTTQNQPKPDKAYDRHPDGCRCESCSNRGVWRGVTHDPDGDWQTTIYSDS